MFRPSYASVLQFAMAHGLTLALKTATVVVVAGIVVVAVAIAQECAVKSTFCTSIHNWFQDSSLMFNFQIFFVRYGTLFARGNLTLQTVVVLGALGGKGLLLGGRTAEHPTG